MKKQPIDDLFAKKLTNWEPKVSPDLWVKIEAKQKKKSRHLGGWFWSVAASLTLLLTTGYLLWQNQPTILTGSEKEIVQTEIKRLDIAPAEEKGIASSVNSTIETAATEESTQKKPETNNAQRYAVASQSATSAENLTETAHPRVRELVKIAAIERKAVESEALVAEISEPSLSQTIEVLAAVSKADVVSENRIIRANVDWDEPGKAEERKDSRFAKIIQQLKNVKQGEVVDWKEVGFNPKKILARADEKIRNEEDKVSRKYQEFKGKTKL